MEFGVKLLPNFLGEAEFAELGKYTAQKALLIWSQVLLSYLEQHGFSLAQVATCCLTQKECQE